MKLKKIVSALTLFVGMTALTTTASANGGALKAFDIRYITNSTCTTCHSGAMPGGTVYQIGKDWKRFGGTSQTAPTDWAGFDAIWAAAYGGVDPNPPAANTDSASVGGCVTDSIATPLSMALAMLTLGFFVRRKKD